MWTPNHLEKELVLMRKEPLAKRIQWVKTKKKITYNRPFQISEKCVSQLRPMRITYLKNAFQIFETV